MGRAIQSRALLTIIALGKKMPLVPLCLVLMKRTCDKSLVFSGGFIFLTLHRDKKNVAQPRGHTTHML